MHGDDIGMNTPSAFDASSHPLNACLNCCVVRCQLILLLELFVTCGRLTAKMRQLARTGSRLKAAESVPGTLLMVVQQWPILIRHRTWVGINLLTYLSWPNAALIFRVNVYTCTVTVTYF